MDYPLPNYFEVATSGNITEQSHIVVKYTTNH